MQNDRKQAANPQWECGLKLKGFGYGDDLSNWRSELIDYSRPSASKIRKSAITEWYVNKPEGLEQGFTLNAPPIRHGTRSGSDGLRLSLQVIGDLKAETVSNQAIILKDKQGRAALSYDKLAAWDADGKSLAAKISVHDNKIMLNVDDRDARYPVTIDPLISAPQKLTASDAAASDAFGTSVALSEDGAFALIGAYGDASSKGSAYVFRRVSGTWSQEAKLTDASGVAGDNFGWAVSLSFGTAAIGAPGTASEKGAVVIFTRDNAGIWTKQGTLVGADSAAGDRFGRSVSINALGANNATVIAGAYQDDDAVGANQGSAYVFVLNNGLWTQQQKLVASDGRGR